MLSGSLSVRKKLFILVALPVFLLVAFVAWQIHLLTLHKENLTKSKYYIDFVEQSGVLYRTEDMLAASKTALALSTLSPVVFPSEDQAEVDGLVSELLQSLVTSRGTRDVYEILDNQEWQSDLYKQLLAKLDRVTFSEVTPEVSAHLAALLQLEWLIYWSVEESRLTKGLIDIWHQGEVIDTDLQEQIIALVHNQQLYVERFVTLNANEQQVSIMVSAFSNEVFSKSQEFRTLLMAQTGLNQLSETEIEQGLEALSGRQALLHQVALSIENQLAAEIDLAVIKAEQSRLTYILAVSLLTLFVIGLAIKLAQHLTSNLNRVLEFLKHDDATSLPSLSKTVKGGDELSEFASEVERLTIERQQAKERLTLAKEEAEKAKDEAILASKAKSSFLANMSHEIRTPLNGVIGIAEVLADTKLNVNQRDYVDTIETSSQLLLSLINDVLDFSKIESGLLLVSPSSTCVRESIYDIASIVAPAAKDKGIELNVSVHPDTPYRVMVDDHRLRQILMNFMSNAVKFTSHGSVSLLLDAQLKGQSKVELTFSVEDTGIGIDEQQQKKIFEPFLQEDNSITREYGGTGLGLAISTQLAELMGSEIQLRSTKGKGSCFYFTLSLPVDVQSYTQSKEERLQTPIAVVCDDQPLCDKVVNELAFYGYQDVERVTYLNEIEAVKSVTAKPVLLIVETKANSELLNKETLSQWSGVGYAIVVARQFNSPAYDFESSVFSIVIQPLLGQRLLRALRETDAVYSGAEIQNHGSPSLGRRRILIVEDNGVNQKIASLHVAKAGFEFDIANHGQEACEMYQRDPSYCLVLMDCMMPVMDGFTATQAIRNYENQQGLQPVPIVALTASVIDDDIQRCFTVGMDDYVAKPFKASVLQEKIRSWARYDTERSLQSMEFKVYQEESSNHNTSFVPKSERILLVEDNLVNQKVASLFLSQAGYQFDIADNGQVALDKFRSGAQYDLILMDCMMPIKDGFSATEEIRQIEADLGLNKIPILALTASVIDDDIQRCYDSGMDGYIAKPVKQEKLLHEIESAI
nr:response regulator [Vibrio aquaticus]